MKIKCMLLILSLCMFADAIYGNSKTKLSDLYKRGEISLIHIADINVNSESIPKTVTMSSLSNYYIDGHYVYLPDSKLNDIKIFDISGRYFNTFGQAGKGPGDFDLPGLMLFSDREIIVFDTFNFRFSIFSRIFDFKRIIKPSFMSKLSPVLIPGGGTIKDGLFAIQTQKNDTSSMPTLEVKSEILLVDTNLTIIKTLYSQTIDRKKITRIGEAKPFLPEVSFCINRGRIVIGYQKETVVKIFKADGTFTSFVHQIPLEKINELDKKRYFKNLRSGRFGSGSGNAEFKKKRRRETVFPELKPYYRQIVADSEGNILIFPYENAEKEVIFYAYDERGKRINKVKIKNLSDWVPYQKIRFMGDGTIWLVRRDSNSENILSRYSVH